MALPDRGLIIRKEWLHEIFHNGKVWEMRSMSTNMRGRIALIEGGSGLIVGQCELVDSFEVTASEAASNFNKHRVADLSLLTKWRFAWVIKNVNPYETPVPYKHPKGAVIWVNLKK